jgi:hypothetical protein
MRLTQLGLTRRTLGASLALVSLTVASFLLLTPGPAAGAGRCGMEFHYFTDATHTLQVGYQGLTPSSCGCRNFKVGTTSAFSTSDFNAPC